MKLNIQNLVDGHYSFEFSKDSEELDVEEFEIFKHQIDVKCELEKRDKNIIVTTYFRTQGTFSCDKCLSEFTAKLEEEFNLLFTSDKKYAEYMNEAQDMVKLIKSNSREIDLTSGVRESLILAIPMKVVCRENCKGLCSGCGVNLNEEPCRCIKDTIDPRLEGLKKLLD